MISGLLIVSSMMIVLASEEITPDMGKEVPYPDGSSIYASTNTTELCEILVKDPFVSAQGLVMCMKTLNMTNQQLEQFRNEAN